MSDPGYPKYNSATQIGHATYFPHGGGTPFQHDNSTTFPQRWEDKSSVKTPGWPSHKQENSYFHARMHREDELTDYHTTFNNGDEDIGQIPPNMLAGGWTGGDDTELRQASASIYAQCVSKLAQKVADSKVNLGVAFYERKQTARLVSSTINRLVNTIRAVKRGNLPGAARSLGLSSGPHRHRGISVPEAWLELQYGWKPLLSDVYGSCEELLNREKERPAVIKATSTSKRTLQDKYTRGPNAESWPEVNFSKEGEVRGSARVWFEVDNSLASAMNRTGITNPLAIAWELVPYSFVVDWFIPVGTFLQNMGYSEGVTFLGGSCSIRSSTKWRGTVVSTTKTVGSGPFGYTQSHSGGSIKESFEGFSREAFAGWPDVPLPHFKDPLSLGHVANALSLLATAFGRGSHVK